MAAQSRGVKELRNRALWYAMRAGQRVGIDVTPHHFYSNTPDLQQLRTSTHWRVPRSMRHVPGAALTEQVARLESWVPSAVSADLARYDLHADACRANGAVGYGRIESDLLYAFMVTHRPSGVLQIGSGVATAVMLRAKEVHDLPTKITCVDPYPTDFLRSAADRGEIELLIEPAQTLSSDTFDRLGRDDLLFIDSTHTVKVGSEVNRLVLDVIPSLAPGVHVHFHDIYFPYDYAPDVVDGELFHWNESVLLHALLTGNEHLSISVSCSMLHHGAADSLRRAFPRYTPRSTPDGIAPANSPGDFPSAIYLQTS